MQHRTLTTTSETSSEHAGWRIRDCMSGPAVCIGPDTPLVRAHRLMRTERVRHLPVVGEDGLLGILTEADVHLAESLRSVDPAEESVESAMTLDPFTVGPDDPLEIVISRMTDDHVDAAVVVQTGKVVGVFTHTDALTALLSFLRGETEPPRRRHP